MVSCTNCVLSFCLTLVLAWADERVLFNEEHERRWNTPPELTPEQVGKTPAVTKAEPRFLPFTASFALSSGENGAHSPSLGPGQSAVSLSQSTALGQTGVGHGGPAISASQSSSFSAGLSGISVADANSFSVSHPLFGANSQSNSNSFGFGGAGASSHANSGNGHASSGAQSSASASQNFVSSGSSSFAGNGHSASNSGATSLQIQGHRQGRPVWTNIAPNYEVYDQYHPNRPSLTVSSRPHGWPNRPGSIRLDIDSHDSRWSQRQPEIHISNWYPNHGTNPSIHRPWNQNGCRNGVRIAQIGNYPTRIICNDRFSGNTQGPWPPKDSSGSDQSSSSDRSDFWMQNLDQKNSQDDLEVNTALINSSGSLSSSSEGGLVIGTAVGVSGIRFPEENRDQNIPPEFIRSGKSKDEDEDEEEHPIETIVSEITDAVADLLDFS